MNTTSQIQRITLLLICIAMVLAFTYFGKPIIIPVVFAVILGIVLRPVEKFLNEKLRIPRIFALLLTVFLFLCLVSAILFFTTYELTRFMSDLPSLQKNLNVHFDKVQLWIFNTLHIPYASQEQYIQNATDQAMANPGTIAQKTMSSLTAIFSAAVVLPVLLFLVMYYRPLFLNFLLKVFGNDRRHKIAAIITDTKLAMQGYVFGLFLEMVTVAALQTLAMWIIGIKYYVFIGLITGVLNMIPYIGIMIAGGLGIMISLATGADTNHILLLILGFAIVQLIDNNILLPRLVAHRVRINAFFSIAGVITGGLISGVAGMFLAIPIMALIKVVFDNIDHLKPWGELMGDTMTKTVKWKNIIWPKID